MSAVALHHLVEGPEDAPAVLLLNSLGSDLRMWDAQAAALADRFRVIRCDLRGHGGSPVPPGPYALADLGADAVALLDHLGLARAHVCGLSLGGMIGMWLGAHAPERVDRLVLCCTSPKMGPPEMWRERAARVRAEGPQAVAAATVGRWLTPAFARDHPEVAAALRGTIAATSAEGYAGCCAAIEHMDLLPDLPRITAPTLVIAGTEDPSTPPEVGEQIATGIPRARLELVPAAHLAAVERPEAVTQLIAAHLGA